MGSDDNGHLPRLRRPTRDDVAAEAGVSSAVVSYVVNDGPRPVAAATRARVLAAIDHLGYQPNEIARSLAGQSTSTVGLIAPTLKNPVWAGVSMGITSVLRDESFLLMVCDAEGSPEQDVDYARMLVAKRVDGVVLVPTSSVEETLPILRDGGIPVVLVEQTADSIPSVVVDAVASGRVVTDHLLDLGHKRIGILREHRTSLGSWQRFLGYEQAMSEAGIAIDNQLVADAAPSIDGGIVDASLSAAEMLLDVPDPPTAVFAHNDLMAIAVLQAARHRGLRVPEDLSVIGIDDLEVGRYVDPPLTTLPFPKRELGEVAARKLLDVIAGTEIQLLTSIAPPPLIVRGSTAPPRGH